jgi:hypothetical protein
MHGTRVIFDESHSEAWTIRSEVAASLLSAHPADASYLAAADELRARGFAVGPHTAGGLTPEVLADADVLVVAHPSDPRWEHTVPGGSPVFAPEEVDAVEAWVRAGGGLVLLGETEQDKYGTNLNELASRFGLRVAHDTVQDYEHADAAPSWVLAELPVAGRGTATDLLARVGSACFYRTGVLEVSRAARVLARTSRTASTPRAPLAAVVEAGAGRVALFADSDLFGDDCLDAHDHRALWANVVHWVAGPAFARAASRPPSGLAADPAWKRLRDDVEALRAVQAPDGTVDLTVHPRPDLDARVDAIARSLRALAPHVPHQAEYLSAAEADLRAWAEDGYGVPDFSDALDAFRPDRHREDGIEHLVLFPMYKQNGSRDKVLEALITRTPWPDWVAELEAERYDNPKFVPVELVDFTAGYDSETAVLFPETVTASRTVNHFGAIFCDREAARLRRTVTAAADVLRLNLPPDAAALVASEPLSRDAYVLWDLIHDRAHSHGDLPFDPFMIRQRQPYWMYGLEELRCDLTAFAEAVALEAEGFAFARNVQYAILFDRLFRFPITGPRVRNYDGLGGQLLFAFLHREGYLHWTDNELTVDWNRVTEGVVALRGRVEDLYRTGIDRSKLRHWAAAHDLVAAYVAPATASKWAAGVRDFPDVDDPRAYIDEVQPDEFPLSLFYVSLQKRLAPPSPAPVAA